MQNMELIKGELRAESLGEKLETVIKKMPPTEITLREILDMIGDDSLMFVTIFLSLVFLVPVSIPGVSTVFGSAILLIGISRLFGRNLVAAAANCESDDWGRKADRGFEPGACLVSAAGKS